MTTEISVAVTRHREVTDNSYGYAASRTKTVSDVLADVTAELDDVVCAAMLRGLADKLDPPPVDRTPHLPEWERDLLRGRAS